MSHKKTGAKGAARKVSERKETEHKIRGRRHDYLLLVGDEERKQREAQAKENMQPGPAAL